jgi:NAD+ kinase
MGVRGTVHSVGLVLHPRRDCEGAIGAVLDWTTARGGKVYGVTDEISRVQGATAVRADDLAGMVDLLVSLGGDGTMLRAMRLSDGHRTPVLGVNLGRLGFLAEVDIPDLPAALTAIDRKEFTAESRLALDADIDGRTLTAFNDVAVVRVPGQGTARLSLMVDGAPFVRYAADAVVVATPTGSTAYSFAAGGPIVSPAVEGLLVTPAAPHSAYRGGLILSIDDTLALEILPDSGRLAVEVDGIVARYIGPGDRVDLQARPNAARVIRLGMTTFYERARRKLRLTDSAELEPYSLAARMPPAPPGQPGQP